MAVKKKSAKKPARARRPATRRPARRATRSAPRAKAAKAPSRAKGGLDELSETVEIMLPELASRLAALEHLLVERKLCAREDLRRALAFVDMRRSLT
jgi:hypothetical protein